MRRDTGKLASHRALDGDASIACDGAMPTPTIRRLPALAALSLLLAPACQSAPTPTPPADADAVAAVRQLVDAVYAWVSGPQGATKDRDALLALFVPDGRMVVARTAADGASAARIVPVGAFADMVLRGVAQQSFYEAPIRTRIEVFGGVAMAWSSYTARRAPDAPPFERGVNCFQLARTADGWRIVSIAWAVETATTKLPADMVDG